MAPELSPRWRLERLVLALDSSRDDRTQLEAAAQLAARMQLELSGWFVEDSALRRLAGLPFAVEVSVLSARSRRFGAGQLQRSLRIQAARLQLALSQAAQAAGVRWSFQALQGRPVDTVLAAARERDLVLLSVGSSRRVGGANTLPTRPVAVVLDATSADTAVLTVAAQLADVDQRPLLVLMAGGEAEAGRLRARVATELAALGVQAVYISVRRAVLGDALDAAARGAADLLVMHVGQLGKVAWDALVQARCPIAVVV